MPGDTSKHRAIDSGRRYECANSLTYFRIICFFLDCPQAAGAERHHGNSAQSFLAVPKIAKNVSDVRVTELL